MTARQRLFPRGFFGRRFHSLMGIWLSIYIIEHLLINSQAAFPIGGSGSKFVQMVNHIHHLPFLHAIEIIFLGIPFLAHGLLGIKYIFTSRSNAYSSGGNKPSLGKYGRNHAYSWQRITAWIILVGIILHVIQMRFLDYPSMANRGTEQAAYMVRVGLDKGLYTVAKRLNIELYDQQRIDAAVLEYKGQRDLVAATKSFASEQVELDAKQAVEMKRNFVTALLDWKLEGKEVVAVAPSSGAAILLTVRNTFKSPLMITLYTLFVLATIYHAFRGVWSFTIVWGVNLTRRSQQIISKFCIGIMVLVGFFGLSAIWLTYLVNLRS